MERLDITPGSKWSLRKHIKPLHQPHEEALVLRTYLSNTIRDEIDSLGDDAGEIWKKLESKYCDEGKLIDSILSEIKFLHPCSIDDPVGHLENDRDSRKSTEGAPNVRNGKGNQ